VYPCPSVYKMDMNGFTKAMWRRNCNMYATKRHWKEHVENVYDTRFGEGDELWVVKAASEESYKPICPGGCKVTLVKKLTRTESQVSDAQFKMGMGQFIIQYGGPGHGLPLPGSERDYRYHSIYKKNQLTWVPLADDSMMRCPMFRLRKMVDVPPDQVDTTTRAEGSEDESSEDESSTSD
jgi:hypothetical protein